MLHLVSVALYAPLMSTGTRGSKANASRTTLSPEERTDTARGLGVGCVPSALSPSPGDPRCANMRATQNQSRDPFRIPRFVHRMPPRRAVLLHRFESWSLSDRVGRWGL